MAILIHLVNDTINKFNKIEYIKEPLMPDYSKNRVLALFKILINYTDEQHQISMQDILVYMEAEGHFCSEDCFLQDLFA